jgi:hypothetical protein
MCKRSDGRHGSIGELVMEYVYMEITKDALELPLACASTVAELAKMRKVQPNTISREMSRAKRHSSKCKYIKVILSEDENERDL